MKRYLVLVLMVCLTLVGCNMKDDNNRVAVAEFDWKGSITEVDVEGHRVLVNDSDKGLIWLSLPIQGDIAMYEVGQEVVVWIDGRVLESSPAQAQALNIEMLEEEDASLHKFDFSNHAFPPSLAGFVDIDGMRYNMAKGGFEWTSKNQSILTDAASPTQIAENLEAIVVDANRKAEIVIEQNPSLSVYRWNAEQEAVAVDERQILLPDTNGRYIYEVVAKWTNGEVSFTFVVEIK